MTLRALLVVPERYGDGALLPDLPDSHRSAVRFARWLLQHVREQCHITVFTNADLPEDDVNGLTWLASQGGHSFDVARADRGSLSEQFLDDEARLEQLGPDDAFVLYWLGHGAVCSYDSRHLLFLKRPSCTVLEDLCAFMRKKGRPERQLYVIDACRERYVQQERDVHGTQPLIAADGQMPHPEWTDQLVLYAAREGEKAAIDSKGGVFTRRLLDELDRLPPRDALDLAEIQQAVTQLNERFADEHRRHEADQIPTYIRVTRKGSDALPGDYRPYTQVKEREIEELRSIVAGADLTASQRGAVASALHHADVHLAEPDMPLEELAVYVAGLLARKEGPPAITVLCSVLADVDSIGPEIRSWYAPLSERAGFPPLSAVPTQGSVRQCESSLVVEIQRAEEKGQITAASRRNPLYVLNARFYSDGEPRDIPLPTRTWRKSQLGEAFLEVYDRSSRQLAADELHESHFEFLVDRELLDQRFHRFPCYAADSGAAPLLGELVPVVLRDRWRHTYGRRSRAWTRIGGEHLELLAAADRFLWDACITPCDLAAVRAAFSGKASVSSAGIVLAQPRNGVKGAQDHVSTALNYGATVAIWPYEACLDTSRGTMVDRRLCRSGQFRKTLEGMLLERPLKDIPDIMFELRTGSAEFPDMAVIFEDPLRFPVARTRVAEPVEGG
ncbi:VMAP-C domain-containing protein [Streptomyces sp. MUM 178J]|uniref:VMAP-C domain-containing protein n=1 Tax=Streptomyces sp. MUM 178J TaxID=2791991 RepID=UPI001F03C14B|nr:caspase family protein [Streptomyces sp. MUM 178J]WRQ80424.1 caspase family protein [Streptomyces sp. MUM 178J]